MKPLRPLSDYKSSSRRLGPGGRCYFLYAVWPIRSTVYLTVSREQHLGHDLVDTLVIIHT
jgi:hypothetical protein